MNKNYDYKRLTPFKWFVLQNFPFIDEDFDAITNYQLFCKLGEEINKLVFSMNQAGEQVEQLTDYVNNYFDNLDLQDEVNNKLDEMAEDGTLEEIITEYINLKSILSFNNVSEMKSATNLINGSFVQTYGYYIKGDGGQAKYKVRTITNSDVIDESFIIALQDENLIAELIIENDIINVKQLGAYGDNIHNDTEKLQLAIDNATNNQTIYIPNGNYKITKQNTKYLIGYSTTTSIPYGLLIFNKNNININCDGILVPDLSEENLVCLFIQTANNIFINGLKGEYNGEPNNVSHLYVKNLIVDNNCNNIKVINTYSKNVGGNTLFIYTNNSIVENSLAERTNILHKANASFGAYESNNIKIINCDSYGGTNDGDISLFANCKNCKINNCNTFNAYSSSPTEILTTTAQGICIDTGSTNCDISNNYVFGYYYGIDVKSNADNILVANNTVVKNKFGISVRMGEANSPTTSTHIDGNIIVPNGGNGNETEIQGGYKVAGIMVQNAYGLSITNNAFSNDYYINQASDFVGIHFVCSNNLTGILINETLISNNQFNMEKSLGNNIARSNQPCLFITGSENAIFKNLSILNNTFKSAYTNSSETPIKIDYVHNINIANNNFTLKPQNNNGQIYINHSSNIQIVNNILERARNEIKIENSDYINIIGNSLYAPAEYAYTVYMISCNYIGFKDNMYYNSDGNEGLICGLDSCSKAMASGNTCKSSRWSAVIGNINNSTDIVNDDTNVFWS